MSTAEEKRKQALEGFGFKAEATDPAKEPGDEKTQGEIDTQKAKDEKASKENDPLNDGVNPKDSNKDGEKPAGNPNTLPGTEALSDEQLLAIASEKAGRKISSWDELRLPPSEDDKKKEQEQKENDKLTFGLQKGLFNKTQYESYAAEKNNPQSVVFSRELAEAKAEDPDWDEDKQQDFEDEFNDRYGLKKDPTSAQYKRGQKQLGIIADTILKTEYKGIYDLDAVYSKHEADINYQKAKQQKVLAAAPQYKEDVTKVLGEFTRIEMDFGGEKFHIPINQEAVKAAEAVLLEEKFAESQILKGATKEELKEFTRQFIIGQNFQQLSYEAAKLFKLKHDKGLRGIPDGSKLDKNVDPYENLNENQRKALDMFRGVNTPVATPN